MDAETEKKLTGQQHQIEMLGTKMEANMKTMKAENESALSKNEAAIERLRTTIFVQMISVAALVVAVVGVFIAYLQFFHKPTNFSRSCLMN